MVNMIFILSLDIILYKYLCNSEKSPKSLIKSRRKCGRLGNTKTPNMMRSTENEYVLSIN